MMYRHDPNKRPDPNSVVSSPRLSPRELREARRLAGLEDDQPQLEDVEEPEPPPHFRPQRPLSEAEKALRRLAGIDPAPPLPGLED